MKDQLLSFLGLARRAGKLSLGHDPVMDQLRIGRARLVLLAKDLSPRTVAGIKIAANEANVPVAALTATMDEIGIALGRRTGVIAVLDAGFAKKLKVLNADQ